MAAQAAKMPGVLLLHVIEAETPGIALKPQPTVRVEVERTDGQQFFLIEITIQKVLDSDDSLGIVSCAGKQQVSTHVAHIP